MGDGIMLIDRQLLDKPPEGTRANVWPAPIVRRAAWTATEVDCLQDKRSGREKRGGSVR